MNYGGFVKLEDGVEGLVHISEMSWTRRINHPASRRHRRHRRSRRPRHQQGEAGNLPGDQADPVNPWAHVEDKYPPGTMVKGRCAT